MAAAVGIAAAEKLAETVLPLLLERLKPDGKEAAAAAGTKTYDQASAMLPTARKCAELLSSISDHQAPLVTSPSNPSQKPSPKTPPAANLSGFILHGRVSFACPSLLKFSPAAAGRDREPPCCTGGDRGGAADPAAVARPGRRAGGGTRRGGSGR